MGKDLDDSWFHETETDLGLISYHPEGRKELYRRFFDEHGVFQLPRTSPLYNSLRIHHFFRGEPVLVNGREAVYCEGKEGLTYYYASDKERKKRVRFRTGDKILVIAEVQEACFLDSLRGWFSRRISFLSKR